MKSIYLSIIFLLTLSLSNHSLTRYRTTRTFIDTGYINGDVYTYKKLTFYVKNNSECFSEFKPLFKKTADSALLIAEAVMNSQEFRDSIAKYSFPCRNYLKYCSQKCTDCNNGIIPTKAIFDSLYRCKRDSLQLLLFNNGDCDGSLGSSSEGVFTINSHYIAIQCDDTLSFAYKYAYHICHEYMHISGFYHYLPPKTRIRNKDIAEKTGWIVYDIITNWRKKGKSFPFDP